MPTSRPWCNTDGVFALLGMVGTENNLQAQQFLAEQGLCVPNLAVATGFPGFGDPEKDPWIINGLPNYALESIAFADYLKENQPDAKVAILSQNDSFGESYVDGVQEGDRGHRHHRSSASRPSTRRPRRTRRAR